MLNFLVSSFNMAFSCSTFPTVFHWCSQFLLSSLPFFSIYCSCTHVLLYGDDIFKVDCHTPKALKDGLTYPNFHAGDFPLHFCVYCDSRCNLYSIFIESCLRYSTFEIISIKINFLVLMPSLYGNLLVPTIQL